MADVGADVKQTLFLQERQNSSPARGALGGTKMAFGQRHQTDDGLALVELQLERPRQMCLHDIRLDFEVKEQHAMPLKDEKGLVFGREPWPLHCFRGNSRRQVIRRDSVHSSPFASGTAD